MSNNLSYARKFIILKKEFSNMKNLNPKGHGKLELKGNKINISINIENVEKNNFYDAMLIGEGKEFNLGRIYTDDNYTGKGDFNLNYKELEGMGFSINRINGILITRDSNILLGGYFNKEDKSIDRYIKKIPPKAPIIEEIVEEKDIKEEIIEIEPEIEMEKPETTEKEEVEIDIQKPIAYKINTEEEYDEIMSEIFQKPIETEEIEDVYIPPKLDTLDEVEPKEYQKNQTTNYVLNILSFFPYIEPFKINLKGYNWWKIDIEDPKEDKGFLPYFSYIAGGSHKYPIIQNTITANDLMGKYGHYLFGLYNIKDEVRFYIYGVPGKFKTEEHPQKGTTGFNTWFESNNGLGYWLLYIDPTNGRIIYPINPMMPIE